MDNKAVGIFIARMLGGWFVVTTFLCGLFHMYMLWCVQSGDLITLNPPVQWIPEQPTQIAKKR